MKTPDYAHWAPIHPRLVKKNTMTTSFVDREFKPPLESHKDLTYLSYAEAEKTLENLHDPAHNWEYFGTDKYGRYAVSESLGIRRGLSMGEFYGSGVVD